MSMSARSENSCPSRLVRSAVLLVLSVLACGLAAQAYEGFGRDPSHFDPKLSGLKIGTVLEGLDDSWPGSYGRWCSSFLAPEGKKPVKTAAMDEELNEYGLLADQWSCMYSPKAAQDGDPKTAWCEGAEGDGIGETMIARVDVTLPVRIWAGFGKSTDLYQKNNRPRRIQLTVLAAGSLGASQFGTYFGSLRAVAQTELELADVNGWQPLKVPALAPRLLARTDGGGPVTFVAVKILSVWPGSTYRDTLISEIGNP